MIVIIAGSRSLTDGQAIWGVTNAVRDSGFAITEVVSGGARGADLAGESWARCHDVPIRRFPPDWNKHGRAAGPIRNGEMVAHAEALIAVWDGHSSGTADVIRKAQAAGLPVHVHIVKPRGG